MTEQMAHKLILEEREKLSMTGVREVVSFDEEQVVLQTDLGTLAVHGRGLKLRQLTPDRGNVELQGRVGALIYEEPTPEGGWIARLLR